MPSLGPAEILVILVIALLVFGPNKLPDIARQVGRGMREFRRVQQHLGGELRDVVSEFDTSTEPEEPDFPTSGFPASDLPASGKQSSSGGDPVPTLPPRIDAPDGPRAPTSDEDDRGQRVWPPPPTADA